MSEEKYLQQIAEEFDEYLKNQVAAAESDFSDGVFVVVNDKKPTGIYISFQAANELPPESKLAKLLKVLNMKFLDSYQQLLEKNGIESK